MVAPFLWPENAGPGLRGNPPAVGVHLGDHFRLSRREQDRRGTAGTLHRMGQLRDFSKLHAVEVESMTR